VGERDSLHPRPPAHVSFCGGQREVLKNLWGRIAEEQRAAAEEMRRRREQRLKELLSYEQEMYDPAVFHSAVF
jgi:hypothetical protein